MAPRVKVGCINKRDRNNAHERIQAIGGVNPDGTRWKMQEEAAIRSIESREYAFYVVVNGREADVVVAVHEGRKYLKTTADGYAPNNLLALPECP